MLKKSLAAGLLLASACTAPDYSENRQHDPCYWLAVYTSPNGRRAAVEDDSAQRVLIERRDAGQAQIALDSICASRKDGGR